MASKTEQKLEYLKGTKDAIKNAIIAKGQAVSDTDTFRSYADKIAAISGGGSADLVYVTFMSHDGATVLHKRAVVKGNTCMCPVTGVIKEIDTPTRESTAQYNYTFAGWATTAYGGLDANALKNVTEDRTVYANYIASVRSYTIRFFDGESVLKSETLPYGSTPSVFIPEKEGYSFAGWLPEVSTVTADVDYYAQFIGTPTFAGSSWDKIIEIAKAGNAAEYFSVGDERTEEITYADGTKENITWMVAGFGDCGVLDADGNDATNNMTIIAAHALATARAMHSTSTAKYSKLYVDTDLYTYLNGDFYSSLPETLQAGIMPLDCVYRGRSATVWIPNQTQCEAMSYDSTLAHNGRTKAATILEPLATKSDRIRTLGKDGAATQYWLSTTSDNQPAAKLVKEDGTIALEISLAKQHGVVPCFCI